MRLSNRYLKRNPDCAWRVIDNQVLIVKVPNGEGNKVFSLNRTGTVIWELANGQRSVTQIIERLKRRFVFDDERQLKVDINAFVEELTERDLLQTREKSF